jgi:hypothetical protein
MDEDDAGHEREASSGREEERTPSVVDAPVGGKTPERQEKKESDERPEDSVVAKGAQPGGGQRADDHCSPRAAERR